MAKKANQLEILPNKFVGQAKKLRDSVRSGPKNHIKTQSQIGRGSRAKGAQGEREALAVLREWLAPVYLEFGVEADKIKRNLDQVSEGGCDLKGLPWLAIEIKRREVISLGAWWQQTTVNTQVGEIPFLMWRCSRQPWRFRVRVPVKIGPMVHRLDIDMEAPVAQAWLQAQLRARLLAEQRGTAREWGLTDNT